jgi:hypothetical protein
MASGSDLHYRTTAQWLADQYEEMDLEKWKEIFPARAELLRAVDEAARRALSRARLEDALTRLR